MSEDTQPTDPAIDADADDDGSRTGICRDGPLAGQELTSRYPLGAIVCDRPAGSMWIYDWCCDGFLSRSGDKPMPLNEDPDDDDNRWRAAAQGDFDVIAAPWAGGDPDQVDAYEGDTDTTGQV